MQICPHCGVEVVDEFRYCSNCGELLEGNITRKATITDFMDKAFTLVKENPRILIPQGIIALLSYVFAFYLISLFSQDKFKALENAMEAGNFEMFYPLLMGGAISYILLAVVGMLASPMIQHVYLSAVKGNGVNFSESMNYVFYRIGDFLRAWVLVIGLFVICLGGAAIIIGISMAPPIAPLIGVLIMMLLFPAIVFSLVFIIWAVDIMVWTDKKYFESLRIVFQFFRRRLGIIIVYGLLYSVSIGIVSMIPIVTYVSFIVTVFFEIVQINIFLDYWKTQ